MTRGDVDVSKLVHDLRNRLAAIYTAVTVIGELPPETPLSAVERHIELILSAVEQSRDQLDQVDRVDGAEPAEKAE